MSDEMNERGNQDARQDDAFRVSASQMSLPKGSGALRRVGEKLADNTVTGTSPRTVTTTARSGRTLFEPRLVPSSDLATVNGPFGFRWDLSLPAISGQTATAERSTARGATPGSP